MGLRRRPLGNEFNPFDTPPGGRDAFDASSSFLLPKADDVGLFPAPPPRPPRRPQIRKGRRRAERVTDSRMLELYKEQRKEETAGWLEQLEKMFGSPLYAAHNFWLGVYNREPGKYFRIAAKNLLDFAGSVATVDPLTGIYTQGTAAMARRGWLPKDIPKTGGLTTREERPWLTDVFTKMGGPWKGLVPESTLGKLGVDLAGGMILDPMMWLPAAAKGLPHLGKIFRMQQALPAEEIGTAIRATRRGAAEFDKAYQPLLKTMTADKRGSMIREFMQRGATEAKAIEKADEILAFGSETLGKIATEAESRIALSFLDDAIRESAKATGGKFQTGFGVYGGKSLKIDDLLSQNAKLGKRPLEDLYPNIDKYLRAAGIGDDIGEGAVKIADKIGKVGEDLIESGLKVLRDKGLVGHAGFQIRVPWPVSPLVRKGMQLAGKPAKHLTFQPKFMQMKHHPWAGGTGWLDPGPQGIWGRGALGQTWKLAKKFHYTRKYGTDLMASAAKWISQSLYKKGSFAFRNPAMQELAQKHLDETRWKLHAANSGAVNRARAILARVSNETANEMTRGFHEISSGTMAAMNKAIKDRALLNPQPYSAVPVGTGGGSALYVTPSAIKSAPPTSYSLRYGKIPSHLQPLEYVVGTKPVSGGKRGFVRRVFGPEQPSVEGVTRGPRKKFVKQAALEKAVAKDPDSMLMHIDRDVARRQHAVKIWENGEWLKANGLKVGAVPPRLPKGLAERLEDPAVWEKFLVELEHVKLMAFDLPPGRLIKARVSHLQRVISGDLSGMKGMTALQQEEAFRGALQEKYRKYILGFGESSKEQMATIAIGGGRENFTKGWTKIVSETAQEFGITAGWPDFEEALRASFAGGPDKRFGILRRKISERIMRGALEKEIAKLVKTVKQRREWNTPEARVASGKFPLVKTERELLQIIEDLRGFRQLDQDFDEAITAIEAQIEELAKKVSYAEASVSQSNLMWHLLERKQTLEIEGVVTALGYLASGPETIRDGFSVFASFDAVGKMVLKQYNQATGVYKTVHPLQSWDDVVRAFSRTGPTHLHGEGGMLGDWFEVMAAGHPKYIEKTMGTVAKKDSFLGGLAVVADPAGAWPITLHTDLTKGVFLPAVLQMGPKRFAEELGTAWRLGMVDEFFDSLLVSIKQGAADASEQAFYGQKFGGPKPLSKAQKIALRKFYDGIQRKLNAMASKRMRPEAYEKIQDYAEFLKHANERGMDDFLVEAVVARAEDAVISAPGGMHEIERLQIIRSRPLHLKSKEDIQDSFAEFWDLMRKKPEPHPMGPGGASAAEFAEEQLGAVAGGGERARRKAIPVWEAPKGTKPAVVVVPTGGTLRAKQAAKSTKGVREAVYVMRVNPRDILPHVDWQRHYGNPWSVRKFAHQETIQVKDSAEAIANYRQWIRGEAHRGVEPKRLAWIRKQVETGALDNKKLIYFKEGKSHADELADLVNERLKKRSLQDIVSEEIAKAQRGRPAEKWVAKELFKSEQATQFIGKGADNSSTEIYRAIYAKRGTANTGVYTADDIVYVSSNGARGRRVNPVTATEEGGGILLGEYKNVKKAMDAKATIISDTIEHMEKTARYNLGEWQLHHYMLANGYKRLNSKGVKSGIWVPVDRVAKAIPKPRIEGILPQPPIPSIAGFDELYHRAVGQYLDNVRQTAKDIQRYNKELLGQEVGIGALPADKIRLELGLYLPRMISDELANMLSDVRGLTPQARHTLMREAGTILSKFSSQRNLETLDEFYNAIKELAIKNHITPVDLGTIKNAGRFGGSEMAPYVKQDMMDLLITRGQSTNRLKYDIEFIRKMAHSFGTPEFKTAAVISPGEVERLERRFIARSSEAFRKEALHKAVDEHLTTLGANRRPLVSEIMHGNEVAWGMRPSGSGEMTRFGWMHAEDARNLGKFVNHMPLGLPGRTGFQKRFQKINEFIRSALTFGVAGVPFPAFTSRNLFGGILQAMTDKDMSSLDAVRPAMIILHDFPLTRWFAKHLPMQKKARGVSLMRRGIAGDDAALKELAKLELKVGNFSAEQIVRDVRELGVTGADFASIESLKLIMAEPEGLALMLIGMTQDISELSGKAIVEHVRALAGRPQLGAAAGGQFVRPRKVGEIQVGRFRWDPLSTPRDTVHAVRYLAEEVKHARGVLAEQRARGALYRGKRKRGAGWSGQSRKERLGVEGGRGKDTTMMPAPGGKITIDPVVWELWTELFEEGKKIAFRPFQWFMANMKTNMLPRQLASSVEDTMRLNSYMSLRAAGVDKHAAVKRVLQAHIDYNYVSEFDRFLRDWMPFIRFRTGTVPRLFRLGFDRPAMVLPFGKLQAQIRQESYGEGGFVAPDYVNSAFAIPLGRDDKGNIQFISSLGVIHEELNAAMGFAGKDMYSPLKLREFGSKEIAGRMHPFLRGFWEFVLNKSAFKGKPLTESREPPSWMTEVPAMKAMAIKAGLLKEIVKIDKRTGAKTTYYKTNQWYHPLTSTMGMNRVDNEISKIFDKNLPWLMKVANVATGVKVVSMNEKRELKRVMRKMVQTMFDQGELGQLEMFFGWGKLSEEKTELLRAHNQLQAPPRTGRKHRPWKAGRGAGGIPSRKSEKSMWGGETKAFDPFN